MCRRWQTSSYRRLDGFSLAIEMGGFMSKHLASQNPLLCNDFVMFYTTIYIYICICIYIYAHIIVFHQVGQTQMSNSPKSEPTQPGVSPYQKSDIWTKTGSSPSTHRHGHGGTLLYQVRQVIGFCESLGSQVMLYFGLLEAPWRHESSGTRWWWLMSGRNAGTWAVFGYRLRLRKTKVYMLDG